MRSNRFLLDTNILIYYLQDQLSETALQWMQENLFGPFQASVVSEIEMMGWYKHDATSLAITELFLAEVRLYSMDDDVAKLAATVRRQHRLKLPDAIIAATALHHNLTLVTHNVRDFTRVEGLRVYDPIA